MIERVYLLLEILAYLLVINDIYERKLKLDFPAAVTIATEVILFTMVKGGELPQIFLLIPYAAVFVYCKVEFDSGIKEILTNMLLTALTLSYIQLLIGFLSGFIHDKDISAIFVNLIVFGITVFLTSQQVFSRLYSYLRVNSRPIMHIVLLCGVMVIFLLFYYSAAGGLSFLDYCLCIMVCFLLVGMIYIWEKEHERLNYKIQELDTFNRYHLEEKILYSDVRKRQHEFKNQLNALYSTHYSCATYEELVAAQREYADWILTDNRYNDLLLSCKPSILAGFICNRMTEAEKQNIRIDYQIHVVDIPERDREYDYICIFGILFDNALEAVKEYAQERRRLDIVFSYDGEETVIRVDNPYRHIEHEVVAGWFKDGYSTKGKNRGHGLGNVGKLRDKYRADIVIENRTKENENWISICFQIKK